MTGPWENALRASADVTTTPMTLAYVRLLDERGTPPVAPRAGYEPKSAFLKAMYAAQEPAL